MMNMKKRIILFSLVVFFTTLCAGLLSYKSNVHSLSDHSLKSKFLQKSDSEAQFEICTNLDIQDKADSDELEKAKLDYSVITQEYISCFLKTYSFDIPSVTIHNHNYIAVPRYILYHSLQVAGY